jgi:DNA polymerase-3 subunit delta'
MQFKDIVAQRVVINRLTEIIDSGRIGHAQLFVGEPASGCLPLAIAYAQYLNCQHRQHYEVKDAQHDLRADSCGECPNCKKYQQLMHPDLHLVFPSVTKDNAKEKTSSNVYQPEFRDFMSSTHQYGTLDDWHKALNVENKQGMIRDEDVDNIMHELSLKSYEGGYKVFVVWMAEKMNTVVANKLLKSFEEPSEKTLFLLVAESCDHMLSTVLSRTQIYHIPTLQEQQLLSSEKKEENKQQAELFVAWMRQLFKLNIAELSDWVDHIADIGREGQKRFLLYAQDAISACLMSHLAGLPLDRTFGDAKFDASFPSMVTINNAEGLCKVLDEARYAIERNAHPKITFMELSFRISKLLKRR